MCQDVAQSKNNQKCCKFASKMKKKRTNPYKDAGEAFLAEETSGFVKYCNYLFNYYILII